MANLETHIDELYQRPLNEFTDARNALARTLSGDAKRRVASLKKPTVALWAVNQLYWHVPATYKALVDASEKLRAAHRAVLEGRKTDLRKAERLHRDTLDRALAGTSKILLGSVGTPSEAVLATVRRVLAVLPGEARAGRLTEEPPPAGFSLLEGVAIKVQPAHDSTPHPDKHARDGKTPAGAQRKSEAEDRRRRKVEAQAQRALDRAKRAELQAAERRKAAEERLAAITVKS